VSRHRLVEDGDCGGGGLAPGDVGAHGVAGVVVDELEDHALAATGQDVLGGVELPASVGCGVDEPPPRRAWPLLRLQPRHTGLTEDPRQRCCRGHHGQTHRAHLVVHADRPVIQPGRLECGPHGDGLLLDLLGQPRRARLRPPGAGLQHRSWAVGLRALAQLVERLTGDAVLGTEGRDRTTGRVLGPLRDRETDTGIDGVTGSHR
jgi:hypothetical protein